MASILTPQQAKTLRLIAATELAKRFYFSGGTALSHYYLQHRYSEDLDFFAEEEFEPRSISTIIKSLQKEIGFDFFDYQNSFNRNLYFLHFQDKEVLKLEFTYYPFRQVEKPKKIDGIMVDSVLDITINKLFTIVQRARGRDYYDLYFINKKYQYDIEQLRMMAKQKFDWHIDPLQLASKFYEVQEHLDDPILNKNVSQKTIIDFFKQAAIKQKSQILV